MKKAAAILFLVLFAFGTFGFTIYYHQCPYKGTSLSFIAEKKCCCSGNRSLPKNCCKNHSRFIKITDSYSSIQVLKLEPTELSIISNQFTLQPVVFNQINTTNPFDFADHSPPEHDVRLFILDRTLLI